MCVCVCLAYAAANQGQARPGVSRLCTMLLALGRLTHLAPCFASSFWEQRLFMSSSPASQHGIIVCAQWV